MMSANSFPYLSGLIITNCILMGRLEAFAMGNKPWPSFLDGIGNAAGYGLILIIVCVYQGTLGSGTYWGMKIIPQAAYAAGYSNNGLMILPPMALVTVGIIIWIQRGRNRNLIEKNKIRIDNMENLVNIFIKSVFIDNMIFAYFLGMCSYLAVSKTVKTSTGLGIAVVFVLGFTVPVDYYTSELRSESRGAVLAKS